MIDFSQPCGCQYPALHMFATISLDRAAKLLIRAILFMMREEF